MSTEMLFGVGICIALVFFVAGYIVGYKTPKENS